MHRGIPIGTDTVRLPVAMATVIYCVWRERHSHLIWYKSDMIKENNSPF